MSIEIFNTLTRKKEKLDEKLNGRKTVRMYSCGVTVYDQCHIGHARSLYVFDVMRRYLTYRGYDMKFVRNITDIDDKIINRAKELKKDWKKVVAENIASYKDDLKALGIAEADQEPRATDNIEDIKKAIGELIAKGYAYVVDGDVYYAVRKFKDYGKLSHQNIEQMEEAVRIDPSEKKQDPLDFALWKKSKEGEPSWPSPWGDGRPGWHIECSCMSLKHLNCETLDIHAGGQDLVFPHHENEIAQSEAWTGKPFARLWIHHGLLTINGQKMSKSLGNFITVEEATQKYSADELKFLFLMSHYASPIDFSEERMNEAKKGLERIRIFLFGSLRTVRDSKLPGVNLDGNKKADFIKRSREGFEKAMDDDFNTPKALASIFDLVNATNRFMDEQKQDQAFVQQAYEVSEEIILNFCQRVFNLEMTWEEPPTPEENQLLKEREEAREKKDFKRSDAIRALLMDKGIIVEDTKDGQVWRRA